MKHIVIKSIAVAALTLGLTTGCSDELNLSPIDPQSTSTYDEQGLLAKMYGMLGLSGQKGPDNSGDMSINAGESGFYRTTFNLEELGTDEILWAWQNDTGIPEVTTISWNSSTGRVQWAYKRLMYDITQYNFYLHEVEDNDANKGVRAEVRFLRALHYWYLLDLFHNCPFKTTFDTSTYPEYKTGAEMVKWLDEELTEIEPQMAEIGAYNSGENYGRADRGAALLLHARLWLNAHVYDPTITTQTAMTNAKKYADELVGKYALSKTPKNGHSGYAQLFMADNDENTDAMKEIIFPIRQDGLQTMTNSCGMYLLNSFRKAGMPDMGTTNGWSCNFSRAALVRKFFPTLDDCPLSTEDAPKDADIKALDQQDGSSTAQIIEKAGDDRALFYGGRGGGVRKRKTDKISSFNDGLSIVKWDNHRADGKAVHNPGSDRPDFDVPLMRYAEVLMIEAEANYRLGNANEALNYINQVRDRAGAEALTADKLSLETICDEWCREFYTEGRRRSDLVRFGVFAGNSRGLNGNMYVWDWKGGSADGRIVDSHFNAYPFPATEIQGNPNLKGHQNPGY
jgi:hypothetical protein